MYLRLTALPISTRRYVTSHESGASNMEGRAADAIVNRDEPAPALTMSSVNAPSATSSDDEHAESKRSRLKEKLSGSKLKQKLHEAGKHRHTGDSLQDRLLSK